MTSPDFIFNQQRNREYVLERVLAFTNLLVIVPRGKLLKAYSILNFILSFILGKNFHLVKNSFQRATSRTPENRKLILFAQTLKNAVNKDLFKIRSILFCTVQLLFTPSPCLDLPLQRAKHTNEGYQKRQTAEYSARAMRLCSIAICKL